MVRYDRGPLVCSAWEPEQRMLRQVAGASLAELPTRAERERFELVLPGVLGGRSLPGEPIMWFALLGVGSMAAAASLARVLSEVVAQGMPVPEQICFVGTAGAWRHAHPVRGLSLPFVATVSGVSWHDADTASGASYLTHPQKALQTLPSSEPDACDDELHGPCVSTWGITRVEPDGAVRYGWLENLELYGMAFVCRQFGIPWRAWLGVSNWLGGEAHQEWLRHNVEASVLAQAKLYAAVFGGGSSSKP